MSPDGGVPGAGPSPAVVERVTDLLVGRRAAPGEIVVLSAGDAAAREIRRRVCAALEHALGEARRAGAVAGPQAHGDRRRAEHLASLLDDGLSDLRVATVSAVAASVLVAHAGAAGLPPVVEILDPAAERADRAARFDAFVPVLLADPAQRDLLRRALALGVDDVALRSLADALHDGLDRLDAGDAGLESDAPDPVSTVAGRHAPATLSPDAVLVPLAHALALRDACDDPDDALARHLDTVVAPAQYRLSHDDEAGVLAALVDLPDLACSRGQQDHWRGRADEVRAACTEAQDERVGLLARAGRAVAGALGARMAGHVLATANARRAEGRLGDLDVLVAARRLLRHEDVARWVRQHTRAVLVDDLGDAGPLARQVADALVRTVAGIPPAADAPWSAPARLVGGVAAGMGSVPGIAAFVDALAEGVSGGAGPGWEPTGRASPDGAPVPPGGHAVAGTPTGPVQLALDGLAGNGGPGLAGPGRGRRRGGTPPAASAAPAVTVLGGPLRSGAIDTARAAADDVARAVAAAVAGRWAVVDPDDRSRRACRWRDIVVVLPEPRGWEALDEALRRHLVPHRVEDVTLLWRTEEVRDVLTLLRAADRPGDAVAVVTALRLAGSACGDDDLVAWRRGGGTWDPLAPVPEALAGHPVAEAMAMVAELHRRRPVDEPSTMVTAAVAALQARELCLAEPHPRDRWHRLRWIEDQARCFDDDVGGSLRAFLRWADARAEWAPATSVGSLEPDDDAVRVVTMGGADVAGAPIVVVAGDGGEPLADRALPAVLWPRGGGAEVRCNGVVASAGYARVAAEHRQGDLDARARQWCTVMARARDHLVVALHHREPRPTRTLPPPLAALFHDVCARRPGLWRRPEAAGEPPAPHPGEKSDRPGAPEGGADHVAEAAVAWDELVAAFDERRAALVRAHDLVPPSPGQRSPADAAS